MNRIVLVPFLIRFPTPCPSIPRPLASARFHRFFAGVCRRWWYSRAFPETSSMTELHSFTLRKISMCSSAFACRCACEATVWFVSHVSFVGVRSGLLLTSDTDVALSLIVSHSLIPANAFRIAHGCVLLGSP